MEVLKISEIIQAVSGKLINGKAIGEIIDISTDSRSIKKGMLFIPLIGDNFDGHDYISNALEKGACACLTHNDLNIKDNDTVIIKVNNTLEALKNLAAYYRSKFKNVPFIAVTGSVGKTSTKDMIANILSRRFNVLKTIGNYNNEIGLPLTIFRLCKQNEFGITEMGMNHFGEIEKLASVVKPETAVITNIGTSHIENLGSKENILKAKMEIFKFFDNNNYAVLNGDDEYLWGLRNKLSFKIVYIGIDNKEADLIAYDIKSFGEEGTKFKASINNNIYNFELAVPGVHNIYNSLIALAIGIKYNVPIEDIINGIKGYTPEKMRMNIIKTNKYKIIDDCYNASPDSMKAALKVLNELGKDNNKVAILGDMLEMGDFASDAHKEIGEFAYKNGVDLLITLGDNGKLIGVGAENAGMDKNKIFHFNTTDDINNFIDNNLNTYHIILVKGSRGMKMENITKYIEKNIKE